MAKIVELTTGERIEFPDSMADDQISSVLQKNLGGPAPAPAPASEPASFGTRAMGVLQSPVVGTEELIANTLTGLGGGQSPTAEALYKHLADSGMLQNVQSAQEGGGPLKYGAMVGQMAPQLAAFAAIAGLGRGAGRGLTPNMSSVGRGLAGFAGATLAPIPAMAPAEAGVIEHALAQTGQFSPDTIRKVGMTHGIKQSALFSGVGIPATDYLVRGVASRFGGASTARAVMKTLGGEAAHIGTSGLAGMAMTGNFNASVEEAIQIENAQRKKEGKEPLDPALTASLRGDTTASAKDMMTLTAILRTPFVPVRILNEKISATARGELKTDDVTKIIEGGEKLDKIYPNLVAGSDTRIGSVWGLEKYKDSLTYAPTAETMKEKYQRFVKGLDDSLDSNPESVLKLAEQQGLDIMGKTARDMRAPLMDKMGVWDKEGPKIVGGLLKMEPVLAQKIGPYLVEKGKLLTDTIEAHFPDTTTETGEAVLRATQMRRDAMARVYGPELAEILIPVEIKEGKITGTGETKIQPFIPSVKYNEYLTNLEGIARSEARERNTQRSMVEGNISAAVSDTKVLAKLTDKERLEIAPESLPANNAVLGFFKDHFTPLQPLMQHIANKFNIPAITDWYYANRKAFTLMHNVLDMVGTYYDHQYKKIPASFRIDPKTKENFNLLVEWMGQDPHQQKRMNLELGKPDAKVDYYTQRVTDSLKEYKPSFAAKVSKDAKVDFTPSEILDHAQFIVGKKKNVFDWYLANGIVPPEKARATYSPVLQLKASQEKPGVPTTPMDQWLWEHREHRLVKGLLGKWDDASRVPQEYQDLMDLTRSMGRKVVNPLVKNIAGKRPGFMEYERKMDPENAIRFAEMADQADEGFVRQVSTMTDPQQITALYSARAARRLAFGPLVPHTVALYDGIENSNIPRLQKDAIYKVMQSMTEQMLGIPDLQTLRMRGSKVLPGNITGAISALHESFTGTALDLKKHPILAKFLGEAKPPVDMAKAMDNVMNLAYMMGLGMPFNMTIPLRNAIQQMPMAVSLFGTKAYMEGMAKFFTDKNLVKELMSYDLRPKKYFLDPSEMSKMSGIKQVTQDSMYLFSMSDVLSVFTAAATAMNQWKKLEKVGVLKEGMQNLTPAEVMDVLIRNKAMKVLPSALEVIKKDETASSRKFWNGVPDKDIIKVISMKLKAGDSAGAKDIFVRYASDLSNFVYGPGGTNPYWRGPATRMVSMFLSWVPNYYSWLGKTSGQGLGSWAKGKGGMLLNRSLQTMAWQIALASMYKLGTGDVRAYQAMNPMSSLPTRVPFGGQIGESLVGLSTWLNNEGNVLAADMMGDDESADTFDRRGQAGWDRAIRAVGIGRKFELSKMIDGE